MKKRVKIIQWLPNPITQNKRKNITKSKTVLEHSTIGISNNFFNVSDEKPSGFLLKITCVWSFVSPEVHVRGFC